MAQPENKIEGNVEIVARPAGVPRQDETLSLQMTRAKGRAASVLRILTELEQATFGLETATSRVKAAQGRTSDLEELARQVERWSSLGGFARVSVSNAAISNTRGAIITLLRKLEEGR